ncbi:protein of unknown function [Pseudorhizobium banfieldiae]|uniref:Uncharacterized protein n=1 Tax=Pseudorhizobium banfieldiae TaxID=1125847 RepID=L0ND08_9HYPH|nr:protein of unknown function [Pseudorhizobium banfieldiae]
MSEEVYRLRIAIPSAKLVKLR